MIWSIKRRAVALAVKTISRNSNGNNSISISSAASGKVRCLSLSRYGLGGQHWKQFNPESYQELIYQALLKNVSYFEVAGPEGGDIAMVGAMKSALMRNPDFLASPVVITTRLGYRNLEATADNGETNNSSAMLGDVDLAHPEEGKKGSGGSDNASYDTPSNVVHNISADYILQAVKSSPLLELQEMENLKLVFLLHNPEVQVAHLLKEEGPALAYELPIFCPSANMLARRP